MEISDTKLIRELKARYKPSKIPPCAVCGKKLTLGKCGGGEPTEWVCVARTPSGGYDWDHYEKSRYTDRRQGGDSLVMELVKRFKFDRAARKSSSTSQRRR